MKIYIINIVFLFIFYIPVEAQKGRIEGRIVDAGSNEPIPFSNVIINGTTIGAMSGFDGKYIITGIDPGFYELQVSSLGYEPVITSEIQVLGNKTAYMDVALRETKVQLGEVAITAQRFEKKEESPVSLRSISISEIENTAGANRDIAKVIQLFPGVASFPAVNRNDIIVRGGASNESRFFVDDIEIPNINHFATQGASGGTNGILNADFMRQADFYAGAFPTSYGNALSGIFDFKQIDGNKEKMKYRTTLGASEIALTADGPLSENTSFILSARRSYLQFLFKALGLPFLPTYNDYQLKSRTRFNEKNELTIISVGSLDQFKLDTRIKNPTEYQQYILNYLPVNEQWSYAAGGTYRHYRDNGYHLLVLSRNMLNNTSYKYLNNDESIESNKILDYNSQEIENKFRYENIINLDNEYKLKFGLGSEYDRYLNTTFQQVFMDNLTDTIDYNSTLDFFRYGAFAQLSRSFFSNRLGLSFGLRFDGNAYQQSMLNPLNQFSPRLSASYNLTERISLNFNTGIYYQLPTYTTLGYRDANGSLVNKGNIDYIRAKHLIGGVEYRPAESTKITLEGFLKLYDHYPFSLTDSISLAHRIIDFGRLGDEPVNSSSTGRAYGFEVLSQTRLSSKANIIISYTFAISEFKDKNGIFRATSWDNRHVFITSITRKIGKSWNIAAKWRFAGGLPCTPYDLDKSSEITAWDLRGQPYYDYSQLNSKRLRPFHQLDLRVDRIFYFTNSSLKIYIDIQNLYNFKSEEQARITNLDENGLPQVDPSDSSRYLLRSIQSDGSGTILPTLGIIFDF